MTTQQIKKNTTIGLILAMAIFLLPGLGMAKSTENLDVVLIMDSSGSMKKTDPQQLRKPAAKLFISLLGKKDRVSVVSFSDQGYPVAYLTPVDNEKNINHLFASVDKISTRGVYTNLSGAIDAAMKVLDRNKAADRLRTIILMSDGKMDMGDGEKEKRLTSKLLEQQTAQLKKMGVEIHTVAFTKQSDQELLKNIAEKTGGQFYMAESDKDLHTVYTSIFEQHKTPNMVPFDGDSFSLDKSVSEATVIGSKDSSGNNLSLISPEGKTYTKDNKPNNIKWMESSQFDLITISQPESGKWTLRSSDGKNKAYVITDLKLMVDIEPSAPAVGEGVMIKAWLEEKGKKLTKSEVISNITVKLHVHTPEDIVHELDMEPFSKYKDDPSSLGVFASHIAFPAEGRFQLDIGFTGTTFSREKISSVNIDTVSSEAKAEPAQYELDNTEHGQPTEEVNQENNEPTTAHSPVPEPSTPVKSESHTAETSSAATESPEHSAPLPAAENIAAKHIALPDTSANEPIKDEHNNIEKDKDKEHKPKQEKVAKNEKNAKDDHNKNQDNISTKGDKKTPGDGDGHENKTSPMLMAIYAFVGINVLLAIIGGGIFFIIKRKKAKANGGDSDADLEKDLADDGAGDKKKAA